MTAARGKGGRWHVPCRPPPERSGPGAAELGTVRCFPVVRFVFLLSAQGVGERNAS